MADSKFTLSLSNRIPVQVAVGERGGAVLAHGNEWGCFTKKRRGAAKYGEGRRTGYSVKSILRGSVDVCPCLLREMRRLAEGGMRNQLSYNCQLVLYLDSVEEGLLNFERRYRSTAPRGLLARVSQFERLYASLGDLLGLADQSTSELIEDSRMRLGQGREKLNALLANGSGSHITLRKIRVQLLGRERADNFELDQTPTLFAFDLGSSARRFDKLIESVIAQFSLPNETAAVVVVPGYVAQFLQQRTSPTRGSKFEFIPFVALKEEDTPEILEVAAGLFDMGAAGEFASLAGALTAARMLVRGREQ